jgi:hypothetical protein
MSAIPISAPSLPATAQVKKILYATDFSEASRKALPLAGALAKKGETGVSFCFHKTSS